MIGGPLPPCFDDIFPLLLGGRTPLGPLRLLVSVVSNDDWQVVLGIGRPIEEGVITDPVW